MPHLLLIDDDPVLIPEQVRLAFPAPAYRVEVEASGSAGLERASARRDPPDVILPRSAPPRSNRSREVYERIRAIDPRIPVIFVTMAKTADTAIEAMRRGAFDYLYKPLDLQSGFVPSSRRP